jgi:predicted transcriptional regulator
MKRKRKSGTAPAKDVHSMTVNRVMEKRVQSVRLQTKADVMASLMIEGFGSVPVVDGAKKLVGVVSEHDVLAAIDDGHKLEAITAGDIMTANPYSVRPETTVGTLVHVLRASDLVRVPVVDAKDRLIGIIARRDVLRTLLAGSSKSK